MNGESIQPCVSHVSYVNKEKTVKLSQEKGEMVSFFCYEEFGLIKAKPETIWVYIPTFHVLIITHNIFKILMVFS